LTQGNDIFDLECKLDASPLGLTFHDDSLLLTNRVEPWGLVEVRHLGGEEFEQIERPVVESTHNQEIRLSAVTWNGSHLVCIAEGSWVESDSELVFMLLNPETLAIEWWYPAPPLLGAIAWDGRGYWAATRRITEAANEPAYLYRINAELDVIDRFPPPGLGCLGLAVHQNLLYFADVFTGGITVLDTSVQPFRVVEHIATDLAFLSGVEHDGEHLWVTDYGSDRLLRIKQQTLVSTPRLPARYDQAVPTLPLPDGEDAAEAPDMRRMRLRDLRAALRSEDPFERMRAKDELQRRGLPPDFDRKEEVSLGTGAEDVSIPWWQAEMSEGTLTASWEISFDPALFSDQEVYRNGPVTVPLFVRYVIEVEGGDLAQPVNLGFEGREGAQTVENQVLATDLAKGMYRINLFAYGQYLQPNGKATALRATALQLEVGW